MAMKMLLALAATLTGAYARFTSLPGYHSPQLGYNSWYDVLMNPSAESVLATAAAMTKSGLQAAGYVYVNLDDGIVAVDRDATGSLVPTPAMGDWKTLSDSLHASGFKFGVYTDRGPKCVVLISRPHQAQHPIQCTPHRNTPTTLPPLRTAHQDVRRSRRCAGL
jgi:hypothetical protein